MFSKDYRQNAHCQMHFNEESIARITSLVSENFPEQVINILDLCCGDGKTTNNLLKKLELKGVKVGKIVGYDISPEQIQVANSKYGDKRLQFKVQDVEKMEEKDSYHVIISLFGLHWMFNINEVAYKIYQASTPNALVYFFIPLEKEDLFNIRKKCLNEHVSIFKGFDHEPFIKDSRSYIRAFRPYFFLGNKTFFGTKEMIYTEEEFKKFLLSWLPEVRYLKNCAKNQIEKYIKRLIELIPEREGIRAIENSASSNNKDENINFEDDIFVSKFNQGNNYKIKFKERFFCFTGNKKELELPPSLISEVPRNVPSRSLDNPDAEDFKTVGQARSS
ncbi:MAG: class I SAM-dependent methyltransferase [Rickettsiales bacterium]|jgi:SAM-dependent methyltransferase|nr:class I SAM-dependent methyltransferase [Rickettsiales bacterium]